jgi:predicted acetylornithine/succinylornithine family transaminase
MSKDDFLRRADEVLLATYAPAPIVLAEGRGCRVRDVDGKDYLDLCAGLAAVSVGHGHPRLAKAIGEQAARLNHVSNLVYNDQAIELASELAQRTPFSRFFFCNSGAEAAEGLIKLARRHRHESGEPERVEIIAAEGSFHGRTYGALSLTGQPKYQAGLGPMLPGVKHVPYGDLDALRAAASTKTAAVVLEPIQGEGGVVDPGDDYLRGVRAICDETGALMFLDEVQTGWGRTGRFLAHEHSGVIPDAATFGKGIGSGFPLAAMAVREDLSSTLPVGSHATTYGGNPLACAAAREVLRIFDDEHLVKNAEQTGDYLGEQLDALVHEEGNGAMQTRGRGLLRGILLGPNVDPPTVLQSVQQRGLLLSLAGGKVLRFTPPLCVTRDEIDEGIEVVRDVLRRAGGG